MVFDNFGSSILDVWTPSLLVTSMRYTLPLMLSLRQREMLVQARSFFTGSLTGDGNFAGPYEFLYPHRFHDLDKGLYLFLITGNLNGIGIKTRINHPAPEYFGCSQHFSLVLLPWGDFDQHHFSFNMVQFCEVSDFYDIDQFVQLFKYLLYDPIVT